MSRAPDGQELAFHRGSREVEPPRRLVSTFVYEAAPENDMIQVVTFEPVECGTLISSSSVHVSLADAAFVAAVHSGF